MLINDNVGERLYGEERVSKKKKKINGGQPKI
jgi:hypothetical protein